MATATSGSAPRRKLATYGKSSRKRIEGFDRDSQRQVYATFNESKPFVRESGPNSKAPAWSKDILELSPVEDYGSYADNGDLSDKYRAPTSIPSAHQAKHDEQTGPIVLIRTPPKKPMRLDRHAMLASTDESMADDGLGVFDVPSSDGEETLQGDKRARDKIKAADAPGRQKRRPAMDKPISTGHIKAGTKQHITSLKKLYAAKPVRPLTAPEEQHGPSRAQHRTLGPGASRQRSRDTQRQRPAADIPSEPADDAVLANTSPSRRRAELRATHGEVKASSRHVGTASGSEVGDINGGRRARNPTGATAATFSGEVLHDAEAFKKRRSPSAIFDITSSEEDSTAHPSRAPFSQTRTPSPRKRQRFSDGLRTPPRQVDASNDRGPADPSQHAGRIFSPRHARMWNQLLDGNSAKASLGGLRMDRLGLSPSRHDAAQTDDEEPKSSFPTSSQGSDVPQARRRLIDTLVGPARDDAEEAANQVAAESDPDDDSATSLFSQSQASGVPETISTQEQFSSQPPEREGSGAVVNSQSSSSQPRVASQPTGLKVTYSRQRSHLTEASLEDETMQAIPPRPAGKPLEHAIRPRLDARALAPSQSGRGMAEDDESGEASNSGTIRSIHELREAGMNKRFLDAVEGMLEDIEEREPSSMSKRRISLLQLACKLCQKAYASRFTELALERRLFAGLASEQDVIAGFVLASAIAILGRDHLASHSISFILEQGALAMLTRLLLLDQDINLICKNRSTDMSRAAQLAVAGLVRLLTQSEIWPTRPDTISPRIIALSALDALSGGFTGEGDLRDILPSSALDIIVAMLAQTFDWTLDVAPSPPKALEIELGLSFLEACTTRPGFAFGSDAEGAAWTQMITELLLYVCRHPRGPHQQMQASVLRLFLNITNNKPSICKAMGTADVTTALTKTIAMGFVQREDDDLDEDEKLSSVDNLILALAAMINLAESSPSVREHVLRRKGDDGVCPLDAMLAPFLEGLERVNEADSMEDTHFNVALGYLAVLLSTISLHAGARAHVCSKLPGRTLGPVKDVAIEFLLYHQQVDSQMSEADDGAHVQDGFTERLQGVIEKLSET